MNPEQIIIDVASPEDAPALLAIYAPYVLQTAITFEYEVPSVKEFQQRIQSILPKYPYLVARDTSNSKRILGYAYASPFHQRAAYQWGVEISIYVEQSSRRCGIGRRLHDALETILKAQNILNMNACIAWPRTPDPYLNDNSVRFHRHMGYRMVGRFEQCGYKFGRWYDMVWMEKHIGEHTVPPAKVQNWGGGCKQA